MECLDIACIDFLMTFFSKCFNSHQTLPRFHTILNGTDGQRTAMTHSWGLSWATGITSISAGWQCQTKGIKSFCGRVLFTSCLKYVAARLLLSDPPCKVSKILANFSQSFFVVSAIGLKGMVPAVRKTQKTNAYRFRSNTTKKNRQPSNRLLSRESLPCFLQEGTRKVSAAFQESKCTPSLSQKHLHHVWAYFVCDLLQLQHQVDLSRVGIFHPNFFSIHFHKTHKWMNPWWLQAFATAKEEEVVRGPIEEQTSFLTSLFKGSGIWKHCTKNTTNPQRIPNYYQHKSGAITKRNHKHYY